MTQKPSRSGTVVVRIPSDVARVAAQVAAMRDVSTGDVLEEAWREYVVAHGDALAASYEAAATAIRTSAAIRSDQP